MGCMPAPEHRNMVSRVELKESNLHLNSRDHDIGHIEYGMQHGNFQTNSFQKVSFSKCMLRE